MSAGRTTLLLCAVMTAIVLCTLGIAIFELYEAAFEEQKARLAALAGGGAVALIVVGAGLVVRITRRTESELRRLNEELEELVTERTRALRESEAQKMEAVGNLTGGIAHDFNNLLTIILGNLDLLHQRLDGDREIERLVRPAREAGRRGAELVERMLAFSRKQILQPRVVDLNRLVLGMTELFRRTLGETIEVDAAPTAGLRHSLIDPVRLETALLNLALNARDAMAEGGRLTVRLANVRGDDDGEPEAEAGEYVRVSVGDTGTGMAPEVMARVFEPFFTTKDVGEGSGLGLSMVYGFARQSGGFVRIDSTLGRGTRVDLYLPATEKPAAVVTEPEPLPERRRASGTVLVVEDEPAVRQVVVTLLSDLGYHVLEAASGPEALSVLDEEPAVDLLFTDLVMPGGTNGLELARQARRRHPHLKVLFGTGYRENVPDQETIPIVRKPYRLEELERTVHSLLGQAPQPDHQPLSEES